MANAKEIQDRMKSINDTLKITNAMYMISSSKLKKSKKMLTDTEPYFFTLQSEMSRILRHLPDLDSIYFRSTDEISEEEKRIAYMVVTADKGLAGSYNHNILKIAEEELAKHPKRQLYVLGEVGRHYFEERGIEINKQFHYTIQNPTLNRARNISEELLEGYRQGDFDEIYIIYYSSQWRVQYFTGGDLVSVFGDFCIRSCGVRIYCSSLRLHWCGSWNFGYQYCCGTSGNGNRLSFVCIRNSVLHFNRMAGLHNFPMDPSQGDRLFPENRVSE